MPDEEIYEIRVGEVLDEKWAGYFEPFAIAGGESETVLRGKVQDQAELFGVLLKIFNLGLKLIAVNAARE